MSTPFQQRGNYKVVHMFAGSGGCTAGFDEDGFETIAAVDNDADACAPPGPHLPLDRAEPLMRSQAELDALGTAFVKDMLAGIGQVTDLGDGLLQVVEKPPEIELPPNTTWHDRKDRLKGSEVSVQVFIDGKPAERLGPFIDLETEVRDNEYLGETTTKYDAIFKGVVMKCEWSVKSKHGLRPLLEGAWSERTRTGAWLVFGKGPRRRYSTKALAEREVQRRRKQRVKVTINAPMRFG